MINKIRITKRTKIIIALVVVMCLSVGFSFVASNPDFYKSTIEVLDEKKEDALALAASATGVAVTITALTKDIAEPIAEILTNIASYTILVTSIIFLEKFLLTIIGKAVFIFIIPIACLLGIIFVFFRKEVLKALAIKLAVFGVLLSVVIPISSKVAVYIEDTYKIVYEQNASVEEEFTTEEKSFLEKLKGETDKVKAYAKEKINYFIDSIAVMLITTCAIPLAVMAFMLWLIKIMFGVEIAKPKPEVLSNKIKNILTDKDKKDAD